MITEERRKEILETAPYWYNKDWSVKMMAKRQWANPRWMRNKNWRKKGSKNSSSMLTEWTVNAVMRMMAQWASEIKNDVNKKQWIKKFVPLSMAAACRELWTNQSVVMYHIKKDPSLSKMLTEYRENKQELMKFVAEDNLSRWLNWELNLEDKELVDLSLKVLERTDKAYNPRIEIEQTNKSLNFNIPLEELEKQFKELVNI